MSKRNHYETFTLASSFVAALRFHALSAQPLMSVGYFNGGGGASRRRAGR
ncbi:hypothetical protein MJ588_11730 [Klebsiella pneumoniae]|nr:hypothetical protein MJ588_11730 [Klebsiella pneumoniae]